MLVDNARASQGTIRTIARVVLISLCRIVCISIVFADTLPAGGHEPLPPTRRNGDASTVVSTAAYRVGRAKRRRICRLSLGDLDNSVLVGRLALAHFSVLKPG